MDKPHILNISSTMTNGVVDSELAALFAQRRSKLMDGDEEPGTAAAAVAAEGLRANRCLSSERRDEQEGIGVHHRIDDDGEMATAPANNFDAIESDSRKVVSSHVVTPSSSRAVTPSRPPSSSSSRTSSTDGPSEPILDRNPTLKDSETSSEILSIFAEARRRLRPTPSPANNVSSTPRGSGSSSGLTTPVAVPACTPSTSSGRSSSRSEVVPRKTSYANTTSSIEKSSSVGSVASAAASTPATTPERHESQVQATAGSETVQENQPSPATVSTPVSPARTRVATRAEKDSSVKSLVHKWTAGRPPLIDQTSTRTSNLSSLSSSSGLRSAASSRNDMSRNASEPAQTTGNLVSGIILDNKDTIDTSTREVARFRELARSSVAAARNHSLSPHRSVYSPKTSIPLRRTASLPRPLHISTFESNDEPVEIAAASGTGSKFSPSVVRHKARMSPAGGSPSRRLRSSPRYQRFLARSEAVKKTETTKESDQVTSNVALPGEKEQTDHDHTLVRPSDEIESMEPYSLRRLEDELDRVVAEASTIIVRRPSNSQQIEIPLQSANDDDSIPTLSNASSHNSSDSITCETRERTDRAKELPVNRPVTPIGGDTSVCRERVGRPNDEQASPWVTPIAGAVAVADDKYKYDGPTDNRSGSTTSAAAQFYANNDDIMSVEESISDDVTVKQGNTVGNRASRREASVHSSPGRNVAVGDFCVTPKRGHISSAFTASPKRSPVNVSGGNGGGGSSRSDHRHGHLLEDESNRLRNDLAKLTMDLGVKDAIIADLKQRLNDLQPDEGQRVEAESLQRMLNKQKEFVPIPRRRANQSETDRRFLC